MSFTAKPTAEKIMKAMLEEGEETFIETIAAVGGKTTYVANATEGTAEGDAVWKIVRILEEAGNPKKIRITMRRDIKLTSRADPTLDGKPAWPAMWTGS